MSGFLNVHQPSLASQSKSIIGMFLLFVRLIRGPWSPVTRIEKMSFSTSLSCEQEM